MATNLDELIKSHGDIECPYCKGKFYLDRPIEDELRRQLEIAREALENIRGYGHGDEWNNACEALAAMAKKGDQNDA